MLRVLTAKFRMGLFEHPYALAGEELKEAVCHKEDKEVSLQSAKESLVLLKNNGALPLKGDKKKIALIGPHADCARKFFGGYTHMCMMESTYAIANSIAGVSGVVQADADKIKTIPEPISNQMRRKNLMPYCIGRNRDVRACWKR